ncbi:MAG: HYR domain-containing protein [Saprospiraceae bacterium]|nr:HYR domain-containing protein [Saprospiraceae bacterium]
MDALTVALDVNGSATVTPDQFDEGSFDNCGIASWSVTPNAFDCSQVGEQVVTVTATDSNGNSSAAQVSVFIVDNIAPGITCRENAILSLCDPVLNFQLPVATDNCAINNSQLIQTAGLAPGASFPLGVTTQSFTYTDAGGTAASCSFTVTVVNALEVNLQSSDATCNGGCNGTASLTPVFGVAPYNVLWSNGATSFSIGNLCAGGYSFTLTDASGCEIIVPVQIAEPSLITVVLDNIVSPFCGADSTGFMSVNVSGGVSPYGYEWEGMPGTTSIDSLSAGSYTLVVTDANDCSTSFTQVVAATDNEAPQIQLNNLTVSLDSNGLVLLSPQQFDAGSTDNCSIDGWSLLPPFLDCGDLGTVTVAATASDGAGNMTTGTFTVTVVDNIAPTLISPQYLRRQLQCNGELQPTFFIRQLHP